MEQDESKYRSIEYSKQIKMKDTKSSEPFYVSVRYKRSQDEHLKSISLPATKAGFERLQEMSFDRQYEALYVSQALFRKGRGIAANLAVFTHIWVDLDCYDRDCNEVMIEVTEKCLNEGIPLPSSFTSSGRGVYLKWIFKDEIYRSKGVSSQRLVTAMNSKLVSLFRDFNADTKATDATRILRVPGSLNLKSGTECYVMHDTDLRYSVAELKAFLLDYSSKEVKEFKAKKNKERLKKKAKILSIQAEREARRPKTGRANFCATSYAHDIIKDLRTLADLRWNGVVQDGSRDIFGHIGISALMSCVDADKLFDTARMYMSDFLPDSYTRKDFEKHSSSAIKLKLNDKAYRYRVSRMIDILSITSDEMQHLKILVDESIKREKRRLNEEKRRRAAGAESRAEYLEKATKVKVWETLGVGKTTYYRNKAKYDAEIAAKREAEEAAMREAESRLNAEKQYESDLKFIASNKAYNEGYHNNISASEKMSTKLFYEHQFKAMGADAFYAEHSHEKIRKMRDKKNKLQRERRAELHKDVVNIQDFMRVSDISSAIREREVS